MRKGLRRFRHHWQHVISAPRHTYTSPLMNGHVVAGFSLLPLPLPAIAPGSTVAAAVAVSVIGLLSIYWIRCFAVYVLQ